MDRLLIDVCWNQRERFSGITNYSQVIENVVNEIGDAKFFGIFKPVNESWQWSYVVEVDGYDNWERLDDILDEKGGEIRRNITHTATRVYGTTFYNAREVDPKDYHYIHFDVFDWEEINLGLKDFFDAYVTVLKDKTNIWLMGCYQPWNEPHNWAFIYLFDNLKNLVNIKQDLWRAVGRPSRASKFYIRDYRRFRERPQFFAE